jgi:hypothetical protein
MKFRPSFLVSSDDCDRVPAEFTPFIATPTVEKKNGTIYGQVRRGSSDIQRDGVFLEVHYYHLWAHDCGQMGHPFDAEHVSALVHAPEMDSPMSEWTAQYWYAAAHQDTICDSSTMTMATTLSATASGPTVWISDGKHASFFSAEDCRKGCGGDRCDLMVPIPYERLVNVGELDTPMNGGTWTAFSGWVLHEKFGNDFNGPTLDVIDSQPAGRVLSVSESPSGVKAIILGGNAGITGLAIGDQHTSNALGVAARKTWKALKIGGGAVKRSLGGGSPQ